MADPKQLELIRQGVSQWNQWRDENRAITPDLRRADLSGANLRAADLRAADLRVADLSEADLRRADLGGANLRAATLRRANLRSADLSAPDHTYGTLTVSGSLVRAGLCEASLNAPDLTWADVRAAALSGADLTWADLREADLRRADLSYANLSGADLGGADLSGANLTQAALIATNLEGAILADAKVYGVSVWDAKLHNAIQTNLVITKEQPAITVDDLEVAQFIYLLLNNSKIRNVIDTITSKAVLILGRFTPERKTTLDTLRDALRSHNYLPILFDFEKPTNRDFTETISTLAHLARFVIADLTDPRSIPQELTAIIPHLVSVPVRPLLFGSQSQWATFADLARRQQVIPPFHYTDDAMLLSCLETDVIAPAEQKARELSTK